ncbi:MAG: hypothetical protein R3B13_17185 [Polyangiaceae bacterium]
MTPHKLERFGRWLFLSNALINWTVSVRGILDPSGFIAFFGGTPSTYPSVIRLWMGFVFMYGCMFFETSRDLRGKAPLIKYNWIEKSITAGAITYGYAVLGDVPARGMALIVVTNWLFIPVLLAFDIAWHRALSVATVGAQSSRAGSEGARSRSAAEFTRS